MPPVSYTQSGTVHVTGARVEAEPDRVLATVMFTDVVDSTQRVASLGDRRWTELLDTRDDKIRRELAAFRGREIKTTGDEFLATFDGPACATRCARAIRAAADDLTIDVRIGLHTGEIEHRGDDIGGLAVHICQRVMAAAQPAETVVSSTVKDLVAGSGIEFVDRGEHELKGVPGHWRLFVVSN
jgi:class 3 adenylate cyclase